MTGLFSQLNLLGNAIHGANEHHRVLSQNIANVNTPGYKTQRVDFDQLIQLLESPDGSRELINGIESQMVEGLAERIDGNNVNLEREVSQLKKNALMFQAYAQLMSSKLDLMRQAMTT